jgi:hypothetical protein
MAYLMSDVAAGSDAALRLQQNMAAAPYVQQETAAAAEETQLKLQQDRLKAQYAPQEAALKLQQDLQTAETTRLANLVASTSYKADNESNVKLIEWYKSPEGQKSTDAEKIRKAAALKGEVGLIKEQSALLKDAELLDDKKFAQDQKKSLAQYDEVARAASVLNNIPEKDLETSINRLPKETTDTIVSQIGEGNWKAMDAKTKRAVINELMYNAKNHFAKEMKQMEQVKQDSINATKIETTRKVQDALANNRQTTNDLQVAKENRLAWNEYNTKKISVERVYQKSLDNLEKSVLDETGKVTPRGMFGELVSRSVEGATGKGLEDHSADRLKKVIEQRDAIQKKIWEEQLSVAQSSPEFPGKEYEIQGLQKKLGIVSGTEPVKPPAASAPPKISGPGGPLPASLGGGTIISKEPASVPSNKALTPEQQTILDKANDAIKKGADPVKVRERLKQANIPGY